jgi:hypothetical protein
MNSKYIGMLLLGPTEAIVEVIFLFREGVQKLW